MLSHHLGLPSMRGSVRYVVAAVVDALGSGLFLPLSLLYFTAVAHLPLSAVGLTLTATTFATLPLTPLAGILVDAIGSRRVTLISQFLQAGGFLGYLFVINIPTLALTSLLVTAGTRMFYAANAVLVAEIAVPDERDRWYGFVNALRNAGSSIGGVIAGGVIVGGSGTGYQALVAGNALSFVVSGILLLRLRTGSDLARHAVKKAQRGGFGVVLRDIPFLGYVLVNFAMALSSMIATIAFPVYLLEALHAPRWMIGGIGVGTTILILGGQTLAVRLTEGHRRTRVLLVANVIRSIGYLLYALAPLVPRHLLVPNLFIASTVSTVGGMLQLPVASALAAEAGPVALRGRYLGVFEFSYGIAAALAPGLFAALYALGMVIPWEVLAGLTAATIGPLLLVERYLPSRAVRREYRVNGFRPASLTTAASG